MTWIRWSVGLAVLGWMGWGMPTAASAATRYVWADSPFNGPGNGWDTAFHDIQSAVDAANAGDTVLVTNGTYATGGRAAPGGGLATRVVVDKAITVRSANGPVGTVIVGQGPLGEGAVRCVYLADGATLAGFTVSNGFTRILPPENADGNGGGVWAADGATVSNCVLTGNSAFCEGGALFGGTAIRCGLTRSAALFGGGASRAILNACGVTNNTARYGGGISEGLATHCLIASNTGNDSGGGTFWSVAINCTIINNSCSSGNGGGTYQSAVTNSIVFYNTAFNGANFLGGSYGYTCTTPDPGGIGNVIPSSPLLVNASSDYHLRGGSPCIDVGSNAALPPGADLDGNVRPLAGSYGSAPVADLGCYEYVNPYWAPPTIWYVWTNSPSDGPGTNWATAFHDIQSGIDAAYSGDTVLVTNGVYATGGRTAPDLISTSRIVATNAITIQSVNGPESTWIVGQGPLGSDAVRCVYLAYGTVLSGFTLTNGFTVSTAVDSRDRMGGAAYAGDGVVITNCILTGNTASYRGGGAHGGALHNCTIVGNACANMSGAGGTYNSVLKDCVVASNKGTGVAYGSAENCVIVSNSAYAGGGTSYTPAKNCLIAYNYATNSGGGMNAGSAENCVILGNYAGLTGGGGANVTTLYNCLVVSNTCVGIGGGLYFNLGQGLVKNCTIAGNTASGAGTSGGGTYCGTFQNCIVYGNSAPTGPNYYNTTAFDYSCTTPLPGGTGNIASAPLFVGAGDYRLQAGSPCIDAGRNDFMPSATDLDGKTRPIDGNGDSTATVDMGCYEYGTPPTPSPTIGGFKADGTGLTMSWSSVAGLFYVVQSTTNLLLGWPDVMTSHIAATPTENSLVLPPDPAPSRFYRVAVE